MSRIDKLIAVVKAIASNHKTEIESLPREGKNGGTNAALINGWRHLGIARISYACYAAGVPRMNYWSGSNPTPAKAIPECIADEVYEAYREIFNKQ